MLFSDEPERSEPTGKVIGIVHIWTMLGFSMADTIAGGGGVRGGGCRGTRGNVLFPRR